MKLIDLDELQEYCWEYPGDIESITIELRNIPTLLSTFPTIEAIPIEWIESYIQTFLPNRTIGYIRKMIKNWREEE